MDSDGRAQMTLEERVERIERHLGLQEPGDTFTLELDIDQRISILISLDRLLAQSGGTPRSVLTIRDAIAASLPEETLQVIPAERTWRGGRYS